MALENWSNSGIRTRAGGAAALVLLCAACATGPRYDLDVPVTTMVLPVERFDRQTLLPKLPIVAGIHYSESFRTATATVGGGYFPRYRYQIGEAAVALFDQNAAVLFARTVKLPSIPESAAPTVGADIVLELRFEPLTSLVFFEVAAPTPMESAFKLQVVVSAPDGTSIARIEAVTAMPLLSDTGTSSTGQPAQVVARKTLIEAINGLSISLAQSPELARWAGIRGIAWQWMDEVSSDRGAAPFAGVAILLCHDRYNCSATEETVAIGKELHRLNPSVTVVAAEDLQRVLHPWMTTTIVAETQEFGLLRHPVFATRAGTVGVRYLVIVESLEKWSGRHGDGVVGGYPPFIGGVWWLTDHESAQMQVFDFATARVVGEIKYQRDGDVSLVIPAFVLPLPIPIPRRDDTMVETIAERLLPLLRPTH